MLINPSNPDERPVVLLIDDSEFVHRLLQARLKSESITLECESDGRSGLERAKSIVPSLILLDLDMPVMDGFEVLRELMDTPETHNIPVIILSSQDTIQDKVTAFDLGAIDFVSKPFELTELRARLRSSLRISSLFRILEQKAQIDGLTGLFNRAYFDDRWAQEYERCMRQGGGLSIAMIDIDHFKQINDTYGHPAGDVVIEEVAKLIQRSIRKIDVACRYGGEEFALVLPETKPGDAFTLCERIRLDCEAMTWNRHPERTITISMGISGCVDGPLADAVKWVEHADSNLYLSKQSGRNKIVCTETAPGTIKLPEAG